MSIDIEQALMLAAAQQSVSIAIAGSNLFRPPNVHVGVCHWVWRPMCLAPRCVPNKPVEFPSTRPYLVDFTDVAQWSSAKKMKVWELTRDKVGATAEHSAVVEGNGPSHPSSVKAYFAVECVFRGMVFLHAVESMHESGLSS